MTLRLAQTSPVTLDEKYNAAAGTWGDKMRALGYFDAYRGFLDACPRPLGRGAPILDIGCGTGAFAEAWVARHGLGQKLSLLDPARVMLDRAQARLAEAGAETEALCQNIETLDRPGQFDGLLAAHVLEHAAEPTAMLSHMRRQVRPGAPLWLVVSKPHWCNAIIWFHWRHKSFRPAEITGFLAKTGWQLEATHRFPSGPPSRTSMGYACRAI